MKIVYCLNHLCSDGGISVVTITKANAFSEIPGFEVFILITDIIDKTVFSKISSKVKIIDLEVNYSQDIPTSRIRQLKFFFEKRQKHKKELKQHLHRINPDIVISVGESEKYILTSIKGRWEKIREIHFPTDYRQRLSTTIWNRILYRCIEIYDYSFKIKGYDRIVVLTQVDKLQHWKNNDKVIVIHNPLCPFSHSQPNSVTTNDTKKIISIGALTKNKNFEALIRVFSLVYRKHTDWTMEIFGEGPEKGNLQNLIKELRLEKVVKLKGVTSNPINEISKSSIFVMASRFEGFGLVLIEAMACGKPVVSYSCPCGPKDIIFNEVDGFLIEPGNEEEMASKICCLIENPDLRIKMGKAAKEKSKLFSIENILPKWIELFKSL